MLPPRAGAARTVTFTPITKRNSQNSFTPIEIAIDGASRAISENCYIVGTNPATACNT
jgi:hypothetical protein